MLNQNLLKDDSETRCQLCGMLCAYIHSNAYDIVTGNCCRGKRQLVFSSKYQHKFIPRIIPGSYRRTCFFQLYKASRAKDTPLLILYD